MSAVVSNKVHKVINDFTPNLLSCDLSHGLKNIKAVLVGDLCAGLSSLLRSFDLAGSERFRDITERYYRIAQIVIVVFDLTNERSLHHTVNWMEEVCQQLDDPVKFLVGTKKDLLSPEAYSDIEQKAITYSHQLEAEFWATSSKTGERVHDVFFRAMCISFDALLLKELMANSSASKEIGIGLLNIQESESDSYEKEKKRFQCSS